MLTTASIAAEYDETWFISWRCTVILHTVKCLSLKMLGPFLSFCVKTLSVKIKASYFSGLVDVINEVSGLYAP